MKLLIVGDSITEGETGISYVEKLSNHYPALHITNLGLGGDTLIGITNRLLEHIRKNCEYDAIVIEAGHNDILIPIFEQGEPPYKMLAKSLITRGSIPVEDVEIFEHQYHNLLKLLTLRTDLPVYITTLSCIGETLSSYPNQKRKLYNEVIHKMVEKYDVKLIDVGILFDQYLSNCVTNHYLLEDFFRAFVVDSKVIKTTQFLNNLSEERKLNVTIDGVHLNEIGANLYFEAFEKGLNLKR